MKKYIKPAVEIVKADMEAILAASPTPNSLNYYGGYSQQSENEDMDNDGLLDDM